MIFVIVIILVVILFLIIHNKTDDQIANKLDDYSKTLWISGLFLLFIIILAVLMWLPSVNSSIRILCGTILVFVIPKFIHMVSTRYKGTKLFSLLLEASSAYFLASNIVDGLHNPIDVNVGTIIFIIFSFLAMLYIEYKFLFSNKRRRKNMNIKQEINQLKKVSKDSLNIEVDDLASQLNDMNNSNKLNKNSLKGFKTLINNNDTIKSHVESIITKISMKILGLK